MKILTSDGKVFQAKTPEGVVRKMRDDMWHWEKKAAYMQEVIGRVEQMTGEDYNNQPRKMPVRADFFLDFLQRAKLITITN